MCSSHGELVELEDNGQESVLSIMWVPGIETILWVLHLIFLNDLVMGCPRGVSTVFIFLPSLPQTG